MPRIVFLPLCMYVNLPFIRETFSLLRPLRRSPLRFVNYWLHFLASAHLSELPFLITRAAISFVDCP